MHIVDTHFTPPSAISHYQSPYGLRWIGDPVGEYTGSRTVFFLDKAIAALSSFSGESNTAFALLTLLDSIHISSCYTS
jgi:hypothetical protein